jgi:hypothetical protein
MVKRIVFSYLGAFLIPICLLPVAFAWTMGGHSLMYMTAYGSLIGITIGLCYSDLRRHYFLSAILVRSFVGLLAAVLVVVAMSEIRVSVFWDNQGWIFIPVCAPLIAAVMSGLILSTHMKTSKQSQ